MKQVSPWPPLSPPLVHTAAITSTIYYIQMPVPISASTGYGNLGFKKPQPLLDGIDSEGYFPWGRPGGGAPLRSSSGNLLVDYRRRVSNMSGCVLV